MDIKPTAIDLQTSMMLVQSNNKSKEDFADISWKGNNVLLFGSEGFGLNQKTEKYVDYFVKIKINDKIDSLNISNSAAIVFHHINKNKKIT